MKKLTLLSWLAILVWFFIFSFPAQAALPAPNLSSSATTTQAGESFTLSWNIPADIPANTNVYYQLSLTDATGQERKGIINTFPKSVTSYTIKTDTEYWETKTNYYLVQARGTSVTNDGWSNIIKITVQPIVSQLTISAVSAFPDEKYILSWTAITDAKKYWLYEANNSAFNNPIKIEEDCYWGCDKKKILSQSNEGAYYYKVKACYWTFWGYKCSDAFSKVVSVAVAKGQGLPVTTPSLNVSPASVKAGESFTLSWDTPSEIPGQTTYHLCVTDANGQACNNLIKTDQISQTITTTIVYWQTDTYYYKVKAIVQGVESGWSKVVKIEAQPVGPDLKIKTLRIDPAQYQAQVSVDSGETYTLVWPAVPQLDYYQIMITDTKTGQPEIGGLANSYTSRNYSHKTLEGKSYCYKLRALKGNAQTFWSKEICVTTKPATLTFKVGKVLPLANEKYSLNWDCPNCPAVSSYILYEDTNPNFGSPEKVTYACYLYGWPQECKKTTRQHNQLSAYYYKIEACNAAGCFPLSPPNKSLAGSVIIQEPILSIKPTAINPGGTYTLDWSGIAPSQVANVKDYQLCLSKTSGACPDGDCQKMTTTGSNLGQQDNSFAIIPQPLELYYKIRVHYTDDKYSVWSNEKKLTVQPNVPLPFSITPKSLAAGEKFILSWGAVPRADKYEICYSEEKSGCQNRKQGLAAVYSEESLQKSGNQYVVQSSHETLLTKTYYYQIRGIGVNPADQQEIKTPWSAERSVKVLGPTLGSGIMPGSAFYFVDRIWEKTTLAFTFDPAKKAEKAMGYAQEKLAEAQAMVIKNESAAVAKATTAYQQYLNVSLAKMAKVKIQSEKEALVAKISKAVLEQQVDLTHLQAQSAGVGQESIQQALVSNQQSLEQGLKLVPTKEKEIREELAKLKQELETIVPLEAAVPELKELVPLETIKEKPKPIRLIPNILKEEKKEVKLEEKVEEIPVEKVEEKVQEEEETELEPACYSNSNCNDYNACTQDICQNPSTAKAKCVQTTISQCLNNDDCCPAGCSLANDNDCPPVCGNGNCEAGESYANCSQDCPAQCNDDLDNDGDGQVDYPADPGCDNVSDNDETNEIACYTDNDCDDGNPCHIYFCEDAGLPDAYCYFYATITDCYDDEYGCCPPGCTSANDNNCS